MMSHFSSILNDAPTLNENLAGDDLFDVMLGALRSHPNADEKMRSGVKAFQVRLSEKGFRYFVAVRSDDTCEDFSVRKCADVLFPGFEKIKMKGKKTRDAIPGFAAATVNPTTALNARISRERTVDGLLRLIGNEIHNFDHIHVPTAFHRLGKLCASLSSTSPSISSSSTSTSSPPPPPVVPPAARPRRLHLADDDNFKALLLLARVMCDDGRLGAQGVSNVVHALATVSASHTRAPPRTSTSASTSRMSTTTSPLISADLPLVFDALSALEDATRRVAREMTSQAGINRRLSSVEDADLPHSPSSSSLSPPRTRIHARTHVLGTFINVWVFSMQNDVPRIHMNEYT